MAKRSREDSDPSSPESHGTGDTPGSQQPASQPAVVRLEQSVGRVKIIRLDSESGLVPRTTEMSFTSYEDYEVHYNQTQVNRCLECRRNFPTTHFLNLHIGENHDALMSVQRDRGEKTYACFVEDCERKCSTPQKRRMHLIDKHLFPKDYDFHIVNDGIGQRTSMLRSGRHRRRSSAVQHVAGNNERARRHNSTGETRPSTEEADTEEEEANRPIGAEEQKATSGSSTHSREDKDMEGLTGAMLSLKFVPPSVRFGRGRGRARGGFSRT